MTFSIEVIALEIDTLELKQTTVQVSFGVTVLEAVEQSGVISKALIQSGQYKVSRYGKLCDWSDTVQPGDRLELTLPVREIATDKRFEKVKSQKKSNS